MCGAGHGGCGGVDECGVGEVVEGRCGVRDGCAVGLWGVVVLGVDGDVVEEDGVEEFLEGRRGAGVKAVAVLEEVEGLGEVVLDGVVAGGEGGEVFGDGGEFAGDAGLFGFEQVEGDGPGVVGLEEFGLLGFECALLAGEVLGVLVGGGVEAVEFVVEVFFDGSPLLGGNGDAAVDVSDAGFDFVDEDGFELALVAVALAVGADEVGVDLSGAGFGHVDDEAPTALPAADGGFEVVVVEALALPVAVLAEDGLHPLPGGFVYEGLVFAGVLDALVGDDSLVVRVAQQVEEFVVVEWMGGPGRRGQSGQATGGEVVGEGGQGPFPCGVLGESQAHEGRALGVELDPAGLPPLRVTALFVEVAQGRPADGAAAPGFLAHSFDHFVGQVAAVELGDGAHDAVQEDAAGGLVDVLRGGDQADARLVEGPVDVDVVGAVAGEAVEFVDDAVVDVPRFLDVGEHLLELRAIGAAGGFSPVDELLDDERAQAGGFLLVGLALGGDGEAFRRPAPLRLPAGGDTDIGDSAFGSEGLAHGFQRVGGHRSSPFPVSTKVIARRARTVTMRSASSLSPSLSW